MLGERIASYAQIPRTLPIMNHAQRLAGVPFFVYRDEHGKFLVSGTSDNCSILLQHLLVLGVLLVAYAKPRCNAFIAS